MSASDIRVSDEERNAAVATLGLHMSTGRLELSEFEERCARAAAARTRGELEALFTDLPAPHPDLSSAAPPGQIQKAGRNPRPAHPEPVADLIPTRASKAWELVAGITLVIGTPGGILLTIFLGQWWVFIPLAILFVLACIAYIATMKDPGAS